MSRLERLSISGIRSFSPVESSVILFNSPLTLIVGENGTGKTTVIESLKYATTGSFPPNTKGGAFVYDPALAERTDVKAEIKLRFVSNAGEQLSCLRVLQVFQRGGKQIQKTLESSLHREAPGERVLLSARLAEVDQAVPGHLGVSQPLLDSVIFCHQEESTWPISEPRVLKERLDQIFDSAKYSRALRALRDARKDVGADIRLKTQSLDFLLKERERKEALQKEMQRAEEAVAERNAALRRLAGERRHAEQGLQGLRREAETHQQIEANMRVIKAEFDNCKGYIRSFGHAVLEDAHVETLLSGAARGPVLEQYRGELCARLAELEALSSGLAVESLEDDYYRMERAAGRYMEHARRVLALRSAVDACQGRLVEREGERAALLAALRAEAGVSAGDVRAGVVRALSGLEAEVGAERAALQRRREALLRVREERGELLQALEEARALCGGEAGPSVDPDQAVEIDYDGLVNLEAELYELEEAQAECRARLSLACRGTERAFRRAHLGREIAALEEACAQVDAAALEARMASLEAACRAAEKELGTRRDEVRRVQQGIAERQAMLARIADEYGILARKHAFPPGERVCAGDALAARALQLARAVDWPACWRLSAHAVARHVVDAAAVPVVALLGVPDEALAPVEPRSVDGLAREIEDCRGLQRTTSNASAIYKNFLGLGRRKSQCPLCKTALCAQALAQFSARLERVVLRLPEELAGAERREEALAAALRCAEAENAELARQNAARGEVRRLRSEAERLVAADAAEKLRFLAASIALHPRRLCDAGAVADDVAHMLGDGALAGAAEEHEGAVAAMQVGCAECRTGLARLGEMEGRLARLRAEAEAEAVPAGEEAVVGDAAHALDRIGAEIEGKRAECARARRAVQEGEALRARAEEARAKAAARARTAALEARIEALGDVAGLEASLNAAEDAARSAYDAYARRRARVEAMADGYDGLCRQAAQLEEELLRRRAEAASLGAADGAEALAERIEGELSPAAVERHMLEMREALLRRKDEHIQAMKAAERCRAELAGVEENIKLRRAKARMLAIQDEIGAYDLKRLERLREKMAQHEGRLAGIADTEASIRGELKQLGAGLAGHRDDLARNYADVGRAYSRCVVHLRALELGASDVERCASALDRAIAEFHAAKIDEVNGVLRELWASTYRGNDIECIELRAETSDSKAYSYSIVMSKNGAKMEMRGRCSAGQKMIASILIRLAMADSFSSNCNILALDEPTTNLDRANVESLAATLALLIKQRSDVQLIVISHDEEFIELLSREGVDYFYRLGRDARGCSRIEKHSVYAP